MMKMFDSAIRGRAQIEAFEDKIGEVYHESMLGIEKRLQRQLREVEYVRPQCSEYVHHLQHVMQEKNKCEMKCRDLKEQLGAVFSVWGQVWGESEPLNRLDSDRQEICHRYSSCCNQEIRGLYDGCEPCCSPPRAFLSSGCSACGGQKLDRGPQRPSRGAKQGSSSTRAKGSKSPKRPSSARSSPSQSPKRFSSPKTSPKTSSPKTTPKSPPRKASTPGIYLPCP